MQAARLLEKAIQTHRSGNLQSALADYELVLQQDAGNADALHLSGLIFHQLGDPEQAIERIGKAIAINPSIAAVHNNLGEARRANGELMLALACYQQALVLDPDYAPARYNSGLAYSAMGEVPRALLAYEAVTKIDPQYVPAWIDLGAAKLAMGLPEDAAKAAGKALEITPANGGAWQLLANSRRFNDSSDALVVQAEQALALPSLNSTDRQALSYALGKMLDDCGEFSRAFHHFRAANEGRSEAAEAAASAMRVLADKLEKQCSPAFVAARENWGSTSEIPVFIVGMPRSGTTLVEQILSMHPEVSARGELKALGQIIDVRAKSIAMLAHFPDVVPDFDADDITGMAEAYLREIAAAPNISRVTDKMPFNSRYIGMIRLLFPNAFILHCQRDPRDTCLSNYFQAFSGNEQSTDLYQLGRYYRAQDNMMQYWKSLYPDSIHTVSYEHLVASPEQLTRDMLTYLKLPWNDQCMDFHSSEKQVQTASTLQVREPLYRRSINRWQQYEEFLEPLLQGLGISA